MKFLVNTLVITTLLAGLVACGGQKSSEGEEVADTTAYDEATKDLPTSSVWANLPDAEQVAAVIHLTGAEYVDGLANDPANVEYYLDDAEGKQAAAVGVYFSDIAYATMYEKGDVAYDAFLSAQKIAENLGTARALNQAIAERFKERLDGNDEAHKVLDEAFDSANENLRTEGRELLSAASLSGWYVEGLYLLTQLVQNYPAEGLDEETKNLVLLPLTQGILKQGKLLNQVIAIVEEVKPDNTRADYFVYDLYDLKESFDKINIDEVIENADPSTMISTEDLAEITAKTATLRERIVAP